MAFDIESIDRNILQQARARLEILAKPPGSLGGLEDIAARICAIFGSLEPDISHRCVLVLAADNGVVEEGVSSAPQSITATQTLSILQGVTGVGALASAYGADLMVADVGVKVQLSHKGLLDRKIRFSTGNIAVEPAMTRDEAERALETGRQLARDAVSAGYTLLGVGEMGIGNTTTSSAVLAALLGLEHSAEVSGRGAGLDDLAYSHKCQVIDRALALHRPDRNDPIDVLHKVGGLDLAAMCGAFLGAAQCRVPVVIDGFISVVAALCAARLEPGVTEYLFASHRSYERGYTLAADQLGLSPCLHLGMRLGEGSGCPLMFSIMDGALAVFKNMATFAQTDTADEYTSGLKNLSF